MSKRKKKLIMFAGLLLTIAGAFKVLYDTNTFKVHEISLSSKKISNGSPIRILQLSDIHNKVFGNQNDRLLAEVKQLNPDIIVITGDLVDRSTTSLAPVFSLMEELVAFNTHTYFVSGNHEWGNQQTNTIFVGLQELGVNILDNKAVVVEMNEQKIQLVGIADYATEHDDIDQAMQYTDETLYTILLSHAPDIAKELNDDPIDLILSGHTHGGQIRVPFIGALVAPGQGYFPKLDKGIYQWEKEKYLYIDSGLGTTWMPIRFLNQSQITFITLTHDK